MPRKKSSIDDIINSAVTSGDPVTAPITETLRSMKKVGDMRIVQIARRTDVQAAVHKVNTKLSSPMKVTQSKVYIFHPESGHTLQNCVLLMRME